MDKQNNKFHYAFKVVIGCAVISMLSAMVINSVGIFYLPVVTEFGITMTQMGLNITIMVVTYTLCMPILNKIVNTYDLRKVLSLCLIGFAVSFIIRALSKGIFIWYITSIILGNSWVIIVNLLGPIIANNWFHKRTATALALISFSINVGGLIFNSIGGWIIGAYGWRVCYFVWAAVALVVGLPFAIFVIKRSPEDMGLLPFGFETDSSDNSIKETVKKLGMSAKEAVKSPIFWMIGIAMGMDGFGDSYSTYISPYAQVLGATAVVGGLMSSCVQFGGMGSRLILGPICDKSAKFGAFMTNFCGVLAFTGMVIISKTGFSTGFYGAMCVLYGVAYSASNIGFSAVTRTVFGPREFNKIWPSLNIFTGVIGAISSILLGLVIDNVGYHACQYVIAIVYLIATACIVMAGFSEKKYKSKWTE